MDFVGETIGVTTKVLPLPLWKGMVRFGLSRATRNATFPPIRNRADELHQAVQPYLTYMRSDEGVYTGRIIEIKKPVPPRDFPFELTSEFAGEHNFRAWLAGVERFEGAGIFDQFKDIIFESEGPATTDGFRRMLRERFGQGEDEKKELRTLLHEYCHWRIFRRTAMATRYDMASWRVRLFQLLLCENIYETVRLPRRFDKASAEKLNRNIDQFSERLAGYISRNPVMRAIFADLAVHHYYTSFFFQTAAAVIIEPVTWALIEPDYIDQRETKLTEYFGPIGSPLRTKAGEVLDLSLDYLAKGRSRSELQKAASDAFDLPGALSEEWPSTDEKMLEVVEELVGRFRDALKPVAVPLTPDEDKKFSKSLLYAVGGSTGDQAVDSEIRRVLVETSSKVLKREADIFKQGVSIARVSSPNPTYDRPMVIAYTKIGQNLVKLRYDELTRLTPTQDGSSPIGNLTSKTTGRPLNRIDDLVGDFPATLGTCLTLLHSMDQYQSDDGELKLRGWKSMMTLCRRLQYRYGAEAYERSKRTLVELMSFKKGLGLTYEGVRTGREHDLKNYFMFWLRFLAKFGEQVVFLIEEHGL